LQGEWSELKVSIILGTRPQIIKSAPVYHAFKEAGVECDIINTGQHYDYAMNKVFFKELDLPDPSVELNVGAGAPYEQVSAIVAGLGKQFSVSAPDVAISPGDTNSALAAGIACSKAGVPLAHLESGCRSNDFRMAEELNRRALDHISQVLLCPTPSCVKNVKAEKVLARVVSNVGDTMYDSLLRFLPTLEMMDAATKHGFEDGGYAFMTLHRAETVDEPGTLRSVIASVGSLGVDVAFSVHPRTRERLKEFGIGIPPAIRLLDPLPYVEALSLAGRSKFVITDSGGLQKEAYWLGKPVLIARKETEWMELVKAGAAFLVGTGAAEMKSGYRRIGRIKPTSFKASKQIFGRGNASANVVRVVSRFQVASRKDES
jgi:UDP-N-acetylglucosamine 2-epimerase